VIDEGDRELRLNGKRGIWLITI